MTQIKITGFNYIGQQEVFVDYNAKVAYRKNGRSYIMYVWVDFNLKKCFVSKAQPREAKVLKGAIEAVTKYKFN